MIQGPRSLTATVHVRFNYDELVKPTIQGQTEILSEIMERISELDPALQEILIKFAEHLKATSTG